MERFIDERGTPTLFFWIVVAGVILATLSVIAIYADSEESQGLHMVPPPPDDNHATRVTAKKKKEEAQA